MHLDFCPAPYIIAAMQTLDLSGTARKTDGPIKSLLWPSVENAWDVDYLGHQGFWLCAVVGVTSFIFLTVAAFEAPTSASRTAVLVMAAAVLFVFVTGGMGVREASWPAAAFVFAIYALNQLGSGHLPGVLVLMVDAVLLSNVRAAFLASRWKSAGQSEDRPMRFNETFRDQLVDQLPRRLWPILKTPFFILAGILFTFVLYLSALVLAHRSAAPGAIQGNPFPDDVPSARAKPGFLCPVLNPPRSPLPAGRVELSEAASG